MGIQVLHIALFWHYLSFKIVILKKNKKKQSWILHFIRQYRDLLIVVWVTEVKALI